MVFEIVTENVGGIAQAIADHFHTAVHQATLRNFADGETQLLFRDVAKVKGKHILLPFQFSFFSGSSDINAQLFNCLLLAGNIKKHGAAKITALLPYLPYSRQDKAEEGDEIGLIKEVVALFKGAGVNEIVLCDLHEPRVIDYVSLPLREIRFTHFWADFLTDKLSGLSFDEVVIVSPDKGGVARVERIAKLLHCAWGYVDKKRVGVDKVEIKEFFGKVDDKVVVLLDDIIDTGNTAVKVGEMLLEHAAREVIGCFTHGILSCGAQEKIDASNFTSVYITNTVFPPKETISTKISFFSIDTFLCRGLEDVLS